MRKGNMTILTSVFVMALVAAGIGMGTMAYFSDVEMSTGNTFTAGTIDIAVGAVGADLQNPWTGKFELEAKPCEVKYIDFVIKNVGNNDLEIWKHLIVTECNDGVNTEPEKEECTLPDGTYVPKFDLDYFITYDLVVNDVVFIHEDDHVKVYMVHCHYIYLGSLAPGASMTVSQSYHLQPEVTNWAQGDVMTFDIELFAQQTASNPPAPIPVYPPV